MLSTSAPSPLCSVIIPCHNYAHLLARAIDSALGQAGVSFEVIVVDDASTDDTAAVAARYGEAVRYQLQPRGGPGVACRNGWFAARGRYVMFLDADDALQPDYLAAMTAALEREQAGVAFPAIVNVAPDGRAKASPPLRLHREPRDNFAAFAQGVLRPSAGGCMLERSALTPFQPLPIRAFQTHGFDRVVIGHLLATQRAVTTPHAVIELYDHPQRLRYDVAAVQHSGLDVVNVLFDSNLLPEWAAAFRGAFEARLLLEHAAMAQRQGDYRAARGLYLAAMRAEPATPPPLARAAPSIRQQRAGDVSTCPHGARPCVRRSGERAMTTADPSPVTVRDVAACTTPPVYAPRGFDRLFRFEPVRALTEAARAGDVVRLGTRPAALLVNHPHDVRHVLARNAANYVKAGFENEFRGLFGDSLITAEGEAHRQDRKRFATHFQERSLGWIMPAVHEATARVLDEWREPVTINLAARMMQLTVEIAGRTMLGIRDPAISGRLQDEIRGMHRAIIRRRRAVVRWPWSVPVQAHRHYRRSERAFNELLERVIADRRARLGDEDTDVLGLMLGWQADSEGCGVQLNDVWVRDQAAQLFFAAYEPLANTLSWTLCLLAQHADEAPEWPSEVPLMDILNESMRLYPPTWLLARRALADDHLPGGANVAAGMRLLISPYLLHRRADLYSAPEMFDPRRPPHDEPYIFIPFGGGPRICLGEHMARLTATTVLAMLLRSHRFILPDGRRPDVESLNHFTAQPRDGVMMMRVESR